MPKGKKGKGKEFADPSRCVDVFGVAPGAALITPSGVQIKVMGMGKVDEMLYATFPGSYVQPLGWPGDAVPDADRDGFGNRTSLSNDVRCRPVADWEELLNAGYRLERRYVREMVHVMDAKRLFDPKLEHDATTFAKHSEMTAVMLEDMCAGAHVSGNVLSELSTLSAKEKARKQRLLISEMPEAVLLPKIRDVLQDPLVGPDNIRKILGIDRMKQLYSSAVQPQQQSVLLSKTAMFDMTQPTSPQKLTAGSAAHVAKEYFVRPENRDEKSNFQWKVKEYFNAHYDELQLPPIVSEYFAQNPVEKPPEKKGKKGKGKKKKK